MFSKFLEPKDTVALTDFIAQKLNWTETGEQTSIHKTGLSNLQAVSKIYNSHQHKPLWITSALADSVFNALNEIENDGLNPSDYALPEILKLRDQLIAEKSKDLSLWADLDILISNALLSYGQHLLAGKIDPKSLNESWNFTKRTTEKPLEEILIDAHTHGKLSFYFVHVRPQNPIYLNMRKSLKSYKLISENGGWQPLVWKSEKSKLEPGDTNPIVPELRIRLAKENLIDTVNLARDSVYDAALQQAVARFQTQHGLYADSVVGKSTIQLLNISVTEKVNAIICNLERMRWAIGDIGGNYIMVNAAQFKLWCFYQDTITWTTEVIIGTPYNATPFFKSELKTVVFNPTWTVPYSIATKEMLPKLRSNANYLASQNMILMNRQGQLIDPTTVNFNSVSSSNFPYIIRQQPGKTNSLGVVKFVMPNPYSIYMHDTPSKGLFKREERAFSHGCIRVNNPLNMAEIVLRNNFGWNADSIQSILNSGKTTQVSLATNIPVLLLYLTQYTNARGQAFFFKDVYKADKKLLTALNK